MSKIKKVFKKYIVFILVLGVIALSGVSVYFYKKSTQPLANDSTTELKMLTKKISKLMVLPTGEEPSLATVADLKPLEGQPFFIDAQIGDKVLIYSEAKKAILYRPENNKIVNIAPLDVRTTPETSIQTGL